MSIYSLIGNQKNDYLKVRNEKKKKKKKKNYSIFIKKKNLIFLKNLLN